MSQLVPLESFDCEGDPSSVGIRWEKWKRGLEIYLLASNIDKPDKQRATLLHVGGLALQEIFYNIPGAVAEVTDHNNVYEIAIQKLDDFFNPKQNRYYERHLFRSIKQEANESFDKFLVRLRQQSAKCKFSSGDEQIIDQIIEKCFSSELRKKLLTLGDSVTLDRVILEGNAFESIERQLNNFKPSTSINRIDNNQNSKTVPPACTRCGNPKHNADSTNCPAINKPCNKCGYIGHFQTCCKTRASKRKNKLGNNRSLKRTKTQHTDKSKATENSIAKSSEIDYIFHIDEDSVIGCLIGGVNVEVLIDSGSKHNIINDQTWSYLKQNKVVVTNQTKTPEKTFMAYGSKEPLTVLGAFDANIAIGTENTTATFYVVKHGSKNLLGKDTAISLNVLRIGLGINTVEEKTFPKFKGVKLEIAIDDSIKPVSQPYRRIPIPLETKVNAKIDELVKLDIIEPVNEPSPWVSPMVPLLKSDGDLRICVDMRSANKAIKREQHPLPTMEQLIPKFRKATVFSKLDIKNAFHQIEVKEDCRHITTFITSKGLFRYKRLMFGISNAPEHFQKILENILLPCDGVVNFIDDILVFGSEDEHDARLKHVLDVLKENNVLLNFEKCIFNAKKINFLGHELSHEGVRPLNKYIQVIESFREPRTIDEIQSFLGLLNYVNKWIPNLATLTEPIREILRMKLHKSADITPYWKAQQKSAFEKLKNSLTNIRTIGFYDPNDRTQLFADASPVGLGAVLVQFDAHGPRVIAFANKSLTDVEKRYCQTEKEALALVWAIEHFKMYLFGKKFELVTDHKPLEVIFSPKSKPCARIERWVLRLQAYDYTVIYRPGKNNIADPFSRLCAEASAKPFDEEYHVNQIAEYARPIAVSLKDLTEASLEDAEILLVKEGLLNDKWDNSVNKYRIFATELWLHNDVLLRGNKIIIPTKLRKRVLEAAHEGHPGIVAMKSRLRTKVWWPKMDKDAESVVKNCKGCILVSGPNPPAPMKRRELPTQAWLDVAIDFLGPLPSGHYLLVIIDYYSRYKEIKIMKSISSKDTIEVLKEIFSRLGIPTSITCDNGRQFVSEEFKSFCQEQGIKLFNTIPYWPQQNGEVERQNRSILKRLKISQIQKSDWKDDLLKYLTMYNSTPHNTTGKTPSELFYNRVFRDKLPSLIHFEHEEDISDTRDRDMEKKEQGKLYGDRKRKAKESDIEIGEKVYVKKFVKDNKLVSDFDPTPHTVIRAKENEVDVRNDSTGVEYRRNVIHLKRTEGKWSVCGNTNDEHNNANVSTEELEED